MNDDEPTHTDNIENLEKRLEAAQKDYAQDYNPKPKHLARAENMNIGARAGVELIGGMLGGGLLGYLLDKGFETSPIFFLIFIILGVIVGFYNIYKITQNIPTSTPYKALQKDEKDAKNTLEDDDEYS